MLYLYCALAGFAGSLLQTVTGFGLAIVVMIALPLRFSYPVSLTISSLLSVGQSATALLTCPKAFRLRVCAVPLGVYLVVCAVAVRFVEGQSTDMMLRLLGGFMVVLGLYFFLGKEQLRLRPTVKNGVLTGTIAGVMGGLFSVTGPPFAVYYLSVSASDQEFLANTRLSLLLVSGYTLILRIASGYLTAQVLRYSAVGLAAMAAGVLVGNAITAKINKDILRRAVYGTMIFSGFVYFFQTL